MKRWIATFFGAGMLPVAPGTAGSLAATGVLFAIYQLRPYWDYGAWTGVLLGGLIAASAAAVALGKWAAEYYGRKDPGSFVLDEVAGICLTMVGLPMKEGHAAIVFVAAFCVFRLFDVWKPWPCGKLESLPAGWGILMDDLGAAVYANILCQLILRFFF